MFFKEGIPIYIGKAINLKRRVSSYFEMDLEMKTARMISSAQELSFIQVASELEALLLEAKLIRLYLPKYNVSAKDDKHPLYILITDEKYPRVITVRKIDLNKCPAIANYGPFPSSGNVQTVLKMIRRIFPYADHKLGKRGCLYSHIGLCNPCPSEIEAIKNCELRIKKRNQYLKNIKMVKDVLSSKFDGVRKELLKEMEDASESENYEVAGQIRDQIEKIEYITRPQIPTDFYMQNPDLYEDLRNKELREFQHILNSYFLNLKSLTRIECFDVAHLAGSSAAASMVTFIKGEPDKIFYRHFKIRQDKRQSDIDSLKEVIKRRLKHIEDWGKPNLIIVDGGTAQVNSFHTILLAINADIPVVGIAKNPDRLIIGTRKIRLKGPALNLVARVRDEAHRFARRYHHLLISKDLIKKDL